jgi:hypothetical protein
MMTSEQTKPPRPQPVAHDEAPSGVTDHPFTPKGEWYSLCEICNLAESAHAETTTRPQLFRYYSDDNPDDGDG